MNTFRNKYGSVIKDNNVYKSSIIHPASLNIIIDKSTAQKIDYRSKYIKYKKKYIQLKNVDST